MALGLLAGPVNQLALLLRGWRALRRRTGRCCTRMTPLGVYVTSLLRGQERASARAAVGIVTAFTGVVVLLLGRGLASVRGSLVGDLLILGAVVAWVLYTTEGQPLRGEPWPDPRDGLEHDRRRRC